LRSNAHAEPLEKNLLQGVRPLPIRVLAFAEAVMSASSAELMRGCCSGRSVANTYQQKAITAATAPQRTKLLRHPHPCATRERTSGARIPPAPTPPSRKLLPKPRSPARVQNATTLFAFG